MNETTSNDLSIRLPQDIDARVQSAVARFWRTLDGQGRAQGASGSSDRGGRSAVTGGRQMDGFADLIVDMLVTHGVPRESIFKDRALELPGYFRPTKRWDLLVVHQGQLLAAMEMKSQAGPSFGNNCNNRAEEAVGSASDIWTAYREGAFGQKRRPWLGYLFLLEDCPKTQRPVRVDEPHYPVFPEFKGASYAKRYLELCHRLVAENLYNETALLLSARDDVEGATVVEPCGQHGFRPFAQSLLASVVIAMGVLGKGAGDRDEQGRPL